MPEGDTVYRTARRLEASLGGARLAAVDGSHPSVRAAAHRLAGATVTVVRSRGKHLMVDTSAGWTIRTHLGMNGSWDLYRPGGRWRRPAGAARVVLTHAGGAAVCFAAPSVEVDRTAVVDAGLSHLGPDLTADEFDAGDAFARSRLFAAAQTAAELVVDQRVMAGAGNVFKSEVLFLEGIDPHRPAERLADDDLRALVARTRRLLFVNRDRPVRVTTGETRPGHELWVYGREGRPCRRCATAIHVSRTGSLERITYACPTCQR